MNLKYLQKEYLRTHLLRDPRRPVNARTGTRAWAVLVVDASTLHILQVRNGSMGQTCIGSLMERVGPVLN